MNHNSRVMSSTDMALAMESARIFAERMDQVRSGRVKSLATLLLSLAGKSLNPHRAMLQVSRIAASLAKTEKRFVDYRNKSRDFGPTLRRV